MAWKQDLSKIKNSLKEEAAPAPPEKPKPKPTAPVRPLEDEDAVFLAAMGQRPARPAAAKVEPEAEVFQAGMAELMAPRRERGPERSAPAGVPDLPPAVSASTPETTAPEPAVPEDFLEAMQGMKGVKAVGGRRAAEKVKATASRPTPPKAPEPTAPEVSVEAPEEALPLPEPPPAPTPVPESALPARPVLIQLAAGMAVEVDGTLDLRGHSVVDARERLEERLQDGRFLGWRTLHVLLGSDPELAGMFEAFLQAVDIRHLSRYAFAPIPMGGAQARILYLVQA